MQQRRGHKHSFNAVPVEARISRSKTMPENIVSRKKLTIRLRQSVYSRLSDHAKLRHVKLTSEVTKAVEVYLEHLQRENDSVYQSPLEQRMQKLENRLAALMAKLVRVCGQALWFSTLPYTKGGLPNRPLSQEAFQILWNNSRQFAAEWLKKAKLDEVSKQEQES